jgi:predicted nucleic acid-binding protein
MTVVDASVVVKWFAAEDHWEAARRLAAEAELAAPSQFLSKLAEDCFVTAETGL